MSSNNITGMLSERIVINDYVVEVTEDATGVRIDVLRGGAVLSTAHVENGPEGPVGPRGAQGERGPSGRSINQTILNSDYTLTLRFSDGTSYTTPSIRGAQGPRGLQGPRGNDGATGPQGPQGEPGGEPEAYLKQVSISGNSMTFTKKDGTTQQYSPTIPSVDATLSETGAAADAGAVGRALAAMGADVAENSRNIDDHDSRFMRAEIVEEEGTPESIHVTPNNCTVAEVAGDVTIYLDEDLNDSEIYHPLSVYRIILQCIDEATVTFESTEYFNVIWANDERPELENGYFYEIIISSGFNGTYLASYTRFTAGR